MFKKIIDVICDWKETCEDFEVPDMTEKGFMKYFELTGDLLRVRLEKDFKLDLDK